MRLTVIALLAAPVLALTLAQVPAPAAAHIGHAAPGLELELERVDRTGAKLAVTLSLVNHGETTLTLFGVFTDLAVVEILDGARELGPGEATKLQLAMVVEGDMPGLFTLITDFGPDGSGPVLVFTGA